MTFGCQLLSTFGLTFDPRELLATYRSSWPFSCGLAARTVCYMIFSKGSSRLNPDRRGAAKECSMRKIQTQPARVAAFWRAGTMQHETIAFKCNS
jgi:hypothetical protein